MDRCTALPPILCRLFWSCLPLRLDYAPHPTAHQSRLLGRSLYFSKISSHTAPSRPTRSQNTQIHGRINKCKKCRIARCDIKMRKKGGDMEKVGKRTAEEEDEARIDLSSCEAQEQIATCLFCEHDWMWGAVVVLCVCLYCLSLCVVDMYEWTGAWI